MDVSGYNVFLGTNSFQLQLSLKITLHGIPFDKILCNCFF